jgi:sec-independent protein translocase protein TatA
MPRTTSNEKEKAMPFSVGPMELVIVLVIALIILGPKRLPEAGKSLGRGMREFKNSIAGMTANDEDDEPAAVEAKVAS